MNISARRDEAGNYIIRITDSGTGIAQEDIEKALNNFGQTDQLEVYEGQGAGLGLPVARALLELHGGAIALESELDKGTVVTITLPEESCRVPEIEQVVHESDIDDGPPEEGPLPKSQYN